jgi:hypothetical protein
MAAQVLTVEVSARRELRRQVRCLAVVSPDGERAIVICRRQVEVVEMVVVVETANDDLVFAPFPLADPALRNGNTFSVNDGELSHQEVVS